MSDIRKLIEAVEGGDWSGSWRSVIDSGIDAPRFNDAYHGSLDAAKALHEALLPGWVASVGIAFDGDEVSAIVGPTGREDRYHEGKLIGPPARAWLLSILKAYEAQQ